MALPCIVRSFMQVGRYFPARSQVARFHGSNTLLGGVGASSHAPCPVVRQAEVASGASWARPSGDGLRIALAMLPVVVGSQEPVSGQAFSGTVTHCDSYHSRFHGMLGGAIRPLVVRTFCSVACGVVRPVACTSMFSSCVQFT